MSPLPPPAPIPPRPRRLRYRHQPIAAASKAKALSESPRVIIRLRGEPVPTLSRFRRGPLWRMGAVIVLALLAARPVWALGEAIVERYHEEFAVFVQQTRAHFDWSGVRAPEVATTGPVVPSAPAVSHGKTGTFANAATATWETSARSVVARAKASAPAAMTANPSVPRPAALSFPTFASLAPEGLRPHAARADGAATRASANPAPATTVNTTDFTIDTALNNSPYTLNTGDSITATDGVVVGDRGTGVLTQNGGTLTVKAGNAGLAGALYVAHASGSTGTYNLNGGSVNVDSFLIGGSYERVGGNGAIVQTGGTVSVSNGLVVGYDAASTSSYSLSAGSLSSNYTIVGGYGTGTFTLSGTGTQTTGDLVLDAYASTGSGTYNLNGGTLTANDVKLGSTGTGVFNFNGGTLQAGASSTTFMQGLTAANVQVTGAVIDTNGFNVTINQALVHDPALGTTFDGGLVKNGQGTLTLTGVNTYTGGERVTAGTLAITAGSTGTSNSAGGVDGGAGGTATLTVSGTGTFVGGLAVGGTGNGVVTQSGSSTVTVSTGLFVGVDNGTGNTGLGTYNLQGGTLTTPTTYVGDSDNSAASVFNQTGGTHTINGALQFGHFNTNSAGTYNLDGGTLTANQIIQNEGTGTFNFNGGTLQAGASSTTFMQGLTAANVRDDGAIIDTNGFNVTVAQALVHSTIAGDSAFDGGLTKEGAGTLTLTGANTYNGFTEVSEGTLAFGAGGSLTGASVITVDPGANLVVNGTVDISVQDSGTLQVSGTADNASSVTLNSGGSLTVRSANISNGTFTQNGGTFAMPKGNNPLNIGTNGTYDLNGGTMAVFRVAGGQGTGTFNFNGGTLQALNSDGPGTNFPKAFMMGLSAANVQAGGAVLDTNGFNVTVAQPLLHDTTTGAAATDGGLTKEGAGTLTLTGTNSYTGPTTVNAGILAINGVQTGTGMLSVASTATLAGTGSIAGAVEVQAGGTFSPGEFGAGRLTLQSSLTLTGAATASFTLGSTAGGVASTQALVGGQINLGTAATLSLTLASGYTPAVGDKFFLLDETGLKVVAGSFANAPLTGSLFTVNGVSFLIDYLDTDPNDPNHTLPNDVSVTVVAAVPEPSTCAWMLGGASLLGLTLLRRPRRPSALP